MIVGPADSAGKRSLRNAGTSGTHVAEGLEETQGSVKSERSFCACFEGEECRVAKAKVHGEFDFLL